MGRIYFYRRADVAGTVIEPTVDMDGVKIGNAIPGGYFYFDKPSGQYQISTPTGDDDIKVTVAAGETLYVRLTFGLGEFVPHLTPTLVRSELGASEIRKCHYALPTQ